MPTTFTDQFYTFDPANPPPAGSAVNFVIYDLVDQNDDDDVDRFNNDTVNGSDVTSSWPGDTVTINVPGTGNVTYTGTTFYLANGQRVFTPTDGQVLENGTFVSSSFVNTQGPLDTGTDLGPPCFTPGTLIATPSGPRRIEAIGVGDLVTTRDHGPQPVRWTGVRRVPGHGDFAPISIAAGALGNRRHLLVSPQHRMLVTGWRAELLCGADEVLVAACHLVDDQAIRPAPAHKVTYLHLMFEAHEIIFAEGAATESLDPSGEFARRDSSVAREIQALFPELDDKTRSDPAAPSAIRRFEGRALVH